MKIILLNGPAGSGKDTIGEQLRRALDHSVCVKFAAPLKRAMFDIYLQAQDLPFDFYDAQGTKDAPQPEFLGKTAREIQIALSETYFKPLHGQDVFGRLLLQTLSGPACLDRSIAIVTDSGFRAEAEVLVQKFGAENILLVNLYRDGKTFVGDSRSYVRLDDLGVKRFSVVNEEEFVHRAVNAILQQVYNMPTKGETHGKIEQNTTYNWVEWDPVNGRREVGPAGQAIQHKDRAAALSHTQEHRLKSEVKKLDHCEAHHLEIREADGNL